MRLFHKIAALVVLAAGLPLATVGFLLVRLNERALEAEVCARFDQTARHAAQAVGAELNDRAHLLSRTAQAIPWSTLDEAETRGALELLARQVDGTAAALLDEDDERAQVEWRVGVAGDDPLGHRARDLGRRRKSARFVSDVVLSAVFPDAAGAPQLIASVLLEGRTVSVALPLKRVVDQLDAVRRDAPLALLLIESDGRVIAASPPSRKTGELAAGALIDRALRGGELSATRRFRDGDHVTVGGFDQVGAFGWKVTIEEDAETALAAPRAMRRMTLYGAAAATAAALALAFLFARRLAAALGRLAAGARALAQGDLTHRIGARGSDEVAELGATFDRMGDQLAASRAEIEKWNHELEDRVAARTEELRQAQAQLVEVQKLAALGQLGAGVAHEINNPLGGVIGHVQLLLADHPVGHADHEALTCIEEAARRASAVVHNLLRFSVQRKALVYTTVDLNRVVRETLPLTEALIRDGGVVLDLELAEQGPRVFGDAGQLGQVLLNLLSNARTATPSGGRIIVRTTASDGIGAFTVEDNGKGIAPENRGRIFDPFFTTKDDWSNVGLGLSVSFRIVSEHRGKITVDSEPGRGARFTVAVPREPPAPDPPATDGAQA